MNANIEIEFKTPISEEQYLSLIEQFQLENNIFKQTNYYFDTEDLFFRSNKIVLRIRKKGDHFYKVTMKSHSEQGAYEQHVLLDEEQALDMITNGFNVRDFFDYDKKVTIIGQLDNYRVSTPYKEGELFFDKIEYYGKTDYEIEYEVDQFDIGLECFKEFLDSYQITQKQPIRKSERIYQENK